MVDINRFVEAGTVNRRTYDAAVGNERADTRVQRDLSSQLYRASQAPGNQPNLQQPPVAPPVPRIVVQVAQVVAQPVQVAVSFVQTAVGIIAQPVQIMLAGVARGMENVIGNVISFFFGGKKTQEKEREDRDLNDAASEDVYVTKMEQVSGTSGSGMGGGR